MTTNQPNSQAFATAAAIADAQRAATEAERARLLVIVDFWTAYHSEGKVTVADALDGIRLSITHPPK